MRFAGVDLAWSPRNPTAGALLRWSGGKGRLAAWSCNLADDDAIVDFVASGGSDVVVAVDGPLAIPNVAGIRPCDALVNAAFRRHGAGVLPANRSNLGRYGGLRGEAIARRLAARGIGTAVPEEPRGGGGRCFECYPRAALVSLFPLPRALPYKARGGRPPAVRWVAFRSLQRCLASLALGEPPLELPPALLRRRVEALGGRALKAYEDLLDALVCAYTALHAWYWGPPGYRLFGRPPGPHILVPRWPSDRKPPTRARRSSPCRSPRGS